MLRTSRVQAQGDFVEKQTCGVPEMFQKRRPGDVEAI
jgi:hypothetical protein